jgi:small nuclear ribonucleoprotein (snRNP)-like protein
MDAKVRVKCLGGRELEGTLRGYDDLINLVLDDCDEFLRGKQNVLCFAGCLSNIRIATSQTPDPLLILKTLKTWNA